VSELEPGPSPAFAAEAAPVHEERVSDAPPTRPTDARELERAAAEARSSRGTLWAWTAGFAALVAIGFLAGRAREAQKEPRLEAIGVTPAQEAPAAHAVTGPPSEAAPVPGAAPPASASQLTTASQQALPSTENTATAPLPQRPSSLISAEEGGFQIFDRILDEGVNVAPHEALLVVPGPARGVQGTLSIDGKLLGPLPAKSALSEGMHELAIARGDSVTYRFLSARRGRTWRLREP
jgi:hypothetical protein